MYEHKKMHPYTRADALRDGAIIDTSAVGAEMRLNFPSAITAGLFRLLDPSPEDAQAGQTFDGRLRDMLAMFAIAAPGQDTDELFFDMMIFSAEGSQTVKIKAVCGPGDDMKPVLSFLLPIED